MAKKIQRTAPRPQSAPSPSQTPVAASAARRAGDTGKRKVGRVAGQLVTDFTIQLATLTEQQSKLATNPIPANATNLHNGKIYYGYYCLMCHGPKGDGNGPVGQSYVPKPTDLSSPRLIGITDGELYRRMLHGEGHDPVLDQTVQPAHRWPLVLYVRTFSR